MGEGEGIATALPYEVGPFLFHDHLHLPKRYGTAEGLAERLLGGEPRGEALGGEGTASLPGVGDLRWGEQAREGAFPAPGEEGLDPGHLHEVDPYGEHRTIRARSAARIASTRATASSRASFTTR